MRKERIKNKWKLYVHRNQINGKVYVGITSKSVEERWGYQGNGYKPHKNHKPTHFWRAIKKYGWNNFDHMIILDNLSQDEAELLEQQYIQLFDSLENGYNSTVGGCVGSKGYKHTEEDKKKMSEIHKKWIPTEEWYKNVSESHKCKRPVICLETGQIYDNPSKCAEKLNISSDGIKRACNNKIHSTNGLHFQFADTEYKSIAEIENTRGNNKKAIVCLETGEEFESIKECSLKTNIDRKAINKALRMNYATKGLHFKYADEDKTLDSIKEYHDDFSSNKVKCIETGEIFPNITECAEKFNTYNSSIYSVCSGKRGSIYGYHFEFINYKPRIRQVICEDTGEIFKNMGECAKQYNLNVRKLSYVLRNGNGKLNNYTFRFYDEIEEESA